MFDDKGSALLLFDYDLGMGRNIHCGLHGKLGGDGSGGDNDGSGGGDYILKFLHTCILNLFLVLIIQSK